MNIYKGFVCENYEEEKNYLQYYLMNNIFKFFDSEAIKNLDNKKLDD